MTFRSQLEPSIKSYECFMFSQNFRFGNHTGLMDSWKILIVFFFFQKPRKVKMHSIIKKTYDFFVKLIKKSQFLLKNSKNATSKNDLKRSIRALNQELWVFYVFAKFQIGNRTGLMYSWKALIVFSFKNRERVKMHSIIK